MSKLRQQVTASTDDLATPAEADLRAYVIFTQLKKDGPFIYAGWLDAPDDEMAIILAKEHYGQDQQCVTIWAAPREFVGGLRENADAAAEAVQAQRDYQLFTQARAGDQHVSSTVVTARCAVDAIEAGRTEISNASTLHNIWAIPSDELLATKPGDMIWRTTDQSYRLARGYGKEVREKWEKIRAERDITEYEKEDLKESF